MSFQARCGADFWLVKCLEVTIKGLGGTAAICLKAGATPLQRERLPSERDICHVTSISPGCGVSPLPFMHLPPHLNTPKMLLCLQVLWKVPPLEPASLGGVKGLKVVLVLKKKEELCVLVANISLELYEVKSESFSLQLLCVRLCPSLAFPIRHHQPPAQREAGRQVCMDMQRAALPGWFPDTWMPYSGHVQETLLAIPAVTVSISSLKVFMLRVLWNTEILLAVAKSKWNTLLRKMSLFTPFAEVFSPSGVTTSTQCFVSWIKALMEKVILDS